MNKLYRGKFLLQVFLQFMKWSVGVTGIICLTAITLLGADTHAQSPLDRTVTLQVTNTPLKGVLAALSRQTSVTFTYVESPVLQSKVSVSARQEKLSKVLDKLFSDLPFEYMFSENKITLRETPPKAKKKEQQQQIPEPDIAGKVTDEKGEPLAGATVRVKGTSLTTTTDKAGAFHFPALPENGVLIVSFIGFQTTELVVGKQSDLTIRLEPSFSKLDEVVVIPYGTTTQRLNTGSVGKITSKEIESQPVGNPLAALEGRVPGLSITAQSGVPGSSYKVQIRGQNSLLNGNDPLFLIDGVPFAPNNQIIGQVSSAIAVNSTQGLSPFSVVNPADIESIEILKDADATAIYGSRGANGVILITTKKGAAGDMKVNVNAYTGISKTTRIPQFMNTSQYLQMRREAFKNDGISPNETNAPDLTVWDTTRYTDFSKMFFGGTAHVSDATTSVSGGNQSVQYLISGSFRTESNVYATNLKDSRASLHSALNGTSKNKRFKTSLTVSYAYDRNNQVILNPGSVIDLAPNLPELTDADGNLVWYYKGTHFSNPLSYLKNSYLAQTDNLNSNLQLSYELIDGLTLKSSLGYNLVKVDETNRNPAAGSDPEDPISRSSGFGNNHLSNWIIEPQIEYIHNISRGKIHILIGGTWLNNSSKSSLIYARGFSSDALMGSLPAATSYTLYNDYAQYRYQAVFGRINYNWEDKYVVNVTARRDGSSRFGPDKRFSNFGAVGGAWIFTNEPFLNNNIPFLSYGKLRGSFGITGSDQIGNYQYLDSWQSAPYPYAGTSAIQPARLANDQYGWEKNRKLEGAIEIGLLNDRILVSTAYFSNLSDNQLISYRLPTQTGFISVTQNFPARIRNTGIEVLVNAKPIISKTFAWTTAVNVTIPKNELVSFPDLETSSYNGLYKVGESLNFVQTYQYLGVDPATGIFKFQDADNDGTYDLVPVGDLNPKFYGGFMNSLNYRKLHLDLFFEFKKQLGRNFLGSVYTSSSVPGTMHNQPVELLNRWQHTGQDAPYQQFTTTTSTDAFAAGASFANTNSGMFGDASYIRLKNVSLSYELPTKWLSRANISQTSVFMTGQNLLTVTRYKVADPETQSISTLAPLRTLTLGLRMSL